MVNIGLSSKLFEFKSLIDGIGIAPQLFTQIIMDALQPSSIRQFWTSPLSDSTSANFFYQILQNNYTYNEDSHTKKGLTCMMDEVAGCKSEGLFHGKNTARMSWHRFYYHRSSSAAIYLDIYGVVVVSIKTGFTLGHFQKIVKKKFL